MNPSTFGRASLVCFTLAIVCYAVAELVPQQYWAAYAMFVMEVIGLCCGLLGLAVAPRGVGRPVSVIAGILLNGGLLALRVVSIAVLWMSGSLPGAG